MPAKYQLLHKFHLLLLLLTLIYNRLKDANEFVWFLENGVQKTDENAVL